MNIENIKTYIELEKSQKINSQALTEKKELLENTYQNLFDENINHTPHILQIEKIKFDIVKLESERDSINRNLLTNKSMILDFMDTHFTQYGKNKITVEINGSLYNIIVVNKNELKYAQTN